MRRLVFGSAQKNGRFREKNPTPKGRAERGARHGIFSRANQRALLLTAKVTLRFTAKVARIVAAKTASILAATDRRVLAFAVIVPIVVIVAYLICDAYREGPVVDAIMYRTSNVDQRAIRSRHRVDERRKTYEAHFTLVRDELTKLPVVTQNLPALSVERLKATVPQLRTQGQVIIDKQPEYEKAYTRYVAAIKRSERALRQESEKHRQHALKVADDPIHRGQYEMLSERCTMAAEALIERTERLGARDQKVKDQVAFIERALVFLAEVELFLQYLPDTEDEKTVEKYLAEIDEFISTYSRIMQALTKMGEAETPHLQET